MVAHDPEPSNFNDASNVPLRPHVCALQARSCEVSRGVKLMLVMHQARVLTLLTAGTERPCIPYD